MEQSVVRGARGFLNAPYASSWATNAEGPKIVKLLNTIVIAVSTAACRNVSQWGCEVTVSFFAGSLF